MIIDTHLHLIDKSALNYPWLAGVSALDRDFLYATYAAEAKRVGIAASLHMEVDVDPAEIELETREVARLAGEPGSLLKGAIAACRPEDEGFAAYLGRQEENAFVKGFRRVLHVVTDDLSEQPLFRENVKRLSGTRFTFDLCVLPHQIPKAIALADLAPDVQFILDHCGVPDIKGHAEHPWRDHMTEIARRPNVVAKISGVVAYAEEDWRSIPSAPMSSTRSRFSDGTGWSGAATGRSAPSAATSRPGSRPPRPSSKAAVPRNGGSFSPAMRNGSGI